MLLMIDNYDSFTYNLVQYFQQLSMQVTVKRNDAIDSDTARGLKPTHLVISPGPGAPSKAGITLDLLKSLAGQLPILGVCLGHQAIGEAFGGKVTRAKRLMHGKTSKVYHDGKTIFKNIPSPFTATRYHSLILEKENLPECLEVSAWTGDGEIMALRHRELMVEGVQFHPESILTEYGHEVLQNFLNFTCGRR